MVEFRALKFGAFQNKAAGGGKKTTCLFLLLVLPAAAAADLKNPEIVTLRNFTRDNIGVYRCTASNDVGEEHCTVEVSMQRESEEVWWGSASSSPRSCDLAAPAAKSTLHPSPDPPTDHFLPDLSGFVFFSCSAPRRDAVGGPGGSIAIGAHHPAHHLAGPLEETEEEVRGGGDSQ